MFYHFHKYTSYFWVSFILHLVVLVSDRFNSSNMFQQFPRVWIKLTKYCFVVFFLLVFVFRFRMVNLEKFWKILKNEI